MAHWLRNNSDAMQVAPGAVHLWLVDLQQCRTDTALLGEEELRRAQRLQFARDRDRYSAAHSALRLILCRYTQTPPQHVVFTIAEHGKPALDTRVHGRNAVAFNLSHSGTLAALAVARDGSIGVDLEIVAAGPERSMVLQLLAPDERRDAQRLDAAALLRAFRIAWTRKEACLKAVGTGFAVKPSAFEVGLEPEARAVWLPASPDLPESAMSRPVHVLTLPESADATISLARVGAPVGAVQTFRFPSML